VRDRFGLGWRPELAAGILSNLDRIDVVEVIAEDLFAASRGRLEAMKTLRRQVPVWLHGVSLGPASVSPVDAKRLGQLAKVIELVQPERWSEHLSFVRAGGREIGHLAAPPRTRATVEGACENLERMTRATGMRPLVENIATLIDPPGSALGEREWISEILTASGNGLLLDLHNLHANATNFGFDPVEFLHALPLERIQAVHLAGGRMIPAPDGRPRVLDDHLHEVPEPVFALLEELAARGPSSLTVILERDGRYPSMQVLLDELERARAAVGRGRARERSPDLGDAPVGAPGAERTTVTLAPLHAPVAAQPSET
jgi:uncharacterized protein (UPF0276 family)